MMLLIIRLLLTSALLWQVYYETGLWTVIVLALLSAAIEMKNVDIDRDFTIRIGKNTRVDKVLLNLYGGGGSMSKPQGSEDGSDMDHHQKNDEYKPSSRQS